MRFFAKKSYAADILIMCVLLMDIFIALTLFIYAKRSYCYVFATAVMTIILIFSIVSITILKKIGLHIEDDSIYYCDLTKKSVDINNIAGIKIIKSITANGIPHVFHDVKDIHGNLLHTAIFLKEVKTDMIEYDNGDIRFNQKFKDSILFWIMYDEEIIDYCTKRNPRIKIL